VSEVTCAKGTNTDTSTVGPPEPPLLSAWAVVDSALARTVSVPLPSWMLVGTAGGVVPDSAPTNAITSPLISESALPPAPAMRAALTASTLAVARALVESAMTFSPAAVTVEPPLT